MKEKFLKHLAESPFVKAALVAGAMLVPEHNGEAAQATHEITVPSVEMRQDGRPVTVQELQKQWKELRGMIYPDDGRSLDSEDLAVLKAFTETHNVSEIAVSPDNIGDGQMLVELLHLRSSKVVCSFPDVRFDEVLDKVHVAGERLEKEIRDKSYEGQYAPFEIHLPGMQDGQMSSLLHEARAIPEVRIWHKYPISFSQVREIIDNGKDAPKSLEIFTDGYEDDEKGLVLFWGYAENNQFELMRHDEKNAESITAEESSRFFSRLSNMLQEHDRDRNLSFAGDLYTELVRHDPGLKGRNDIGPADL